MLFQLTHSHRPTASATPNVCVFIDPDTISILMATPSEVIRILFALLLAIAIARRGLRSQSLSQSGAVAAFLVGFLSLASSIRFGATLYVFYLSSTRATKYKGVLKATLEDGHTTLGNRNATQVFASSLPAVVLAICYVLVYRHDAPISEALYERGVLLLAYLLFFAACAGDTFASEIGIVAGEPVLVIAPWRQVPPGTNGGLTAAGTIASGMGGLIIGLVYFLTGPVWTWSQLRLIWVGFCGGAIGSLADSIIGAILQASWLDNVSGKVLKEKPRIIVGSEKRYQHICGWDVLSGESVNALSAMISAAIAPFIISWFPAATRVPE